MCNSRSSCNSPSVVKYLPAVALAIFLAWPSAASAVVGCIGISPPNPTPNDIITISVSGGFYDACWGMEDDSLLPVANGFHIDLLAADNWEPGGGCFQYAPPYEFSYQVGPLSPGSYIVSATEHRQSLRDSGSQTITTSFVVSSLDACCIGMRGNIDNSPDFALDISDLTFLVDYMFLGGPSPACFEEADVAVNSRLDIADLVCLVDYMFRSGPEPPACPPLGDLYNYTAYDSAGVAVVQGTLDLAITEWGDFIGSWVLQAIGDPGQVGPQVGEGILLGNTYPNDSVSIGLNPYLIDANVYLEGTMSDSAIIGEWFYIGFPGLINQGTFTAFRR